MIDFDHVLPPTGRYRCGGDHCSTVLERPGVCDGCAHAEVLKAHERAIKAWVAQLPRRFRDASWDALGRLARDDGRSRVIMPLDRLGRLRERMDRAARAVLMGPAGSGKTTVAIAHLRAAVESDARSRVRFIPAADLDREETPDGGPTPLALALSADVLVLDDLGAELEQAEVGSGLLAQRVGAASTVIASRFDRGYPIVVTTGIDRARLEKLYGDRIARRIFEGAVVAKFGEVETDLRKTG